MATLNRVQVLVIGFFVLVWLALVVILLVAPDVYEKTLRDAGGKDARVEAAFLLALSALIAFLVVGVVRRWRWTFWVVLIAFLFGVVRVPAAGLQLAGALAASGPAWYEALQAVIGAAQFAIAIAMIVGCRKSGIWGDF